VEEPPPPAEAAVEAPRPLKRPAPAVTVQVARTRLKDARARSARVSAQGVRRLVDAELAQLEKRLESGEAPTKVVADMQHVLEDYRVP